MKLNCLRDYIKLFIKEKYITNDDESVWFRLYLDSDLNYRYVKVVFGEKKNEFTIECETSKDKIIKEPRLLDLPVLNVYMIVYDPKSEDGQNFRGKFKKVCIDEVEDLITGKIKYAIMPNMSSLKKEFSGDVRWELKFTCMDLPSVYLNSFLFRESILRPIIYNTLQEHGNTILSKTNYDKAMKYIQKHKSEFNFDSNDYHTILESSINSVSVGHKKYRIRFVNDSSSPFYVIEEIKNKLNMNMPKIDLEK